MDFCLAITTCSLDGFYGNLMPQWDGKCNYLCFGKSYLFLSCFSRLISFCLCLCRERQKLEAERLAREVRSNSLRRKSFVGKSGLLSDYCLFTEVTEVWEPLLYRDIWVDPWIYISLCHTLFFSYFRFCSFIYSTQAQEAVYYEILCSFIYSFTVFGLLPRLDWNQKNNLVMK